MLEALFAIKINLSSLSFRDKKKKIKMIKKYFKEEKAQKGEVINTKSGHQIRASVKISLVKLDPVSFFFFKPLKMFMPFGVFLICINFSWPSFVAYCTNRRSTKTQTNYRAVGGGGGYQYPHRCWRHSDGVYSIHISAGIRFVLTPLDLTVLRFQCLSGFDMCPQKVCKSLGWNRKCLKVVLSSLCRLC